MQVGELDVVCDDAVAGGDRLVKCSERRVEDGFILPLGVWEEK